MKVDMNLVLTITYTVIFIIVLIVIVLLNKRRQINRCKKTIENLEFEKNVISSTAIASELDKVETIIKNEKAEEKFNNWVDRFTEIKEERIPVLDDMIIDLEILLDKKDYSNFFIKEAKTEIELYKIKNANDTLMQEIQEVNSSEEKYRTIITKLKSKYRELSNIFVNTKEEYGEIASTIELQFENIERRFQDFEDFMESNEYSEVVHIVKAIDTMIDHMTTIVEETPDLVLLATKLIPKKIEQITEVYEKMLDENYPLDYLNITYNMEESIKNVNLLMDRIRVLNLEDCLFELKTMISYLDSLFEDFDREKISRKDYELNQVLFNERLKKTNKIFSDIFKQMENIKVTYALSEEDLETFDTVNNSLRELNKNYKKQLKDLEKKKIPYSEANSLLNENSISLKRNEEDLDHSLKALGNMYDDEQRAREQLDEIQELLAGAKIKQRLYKFPVIDQRYFVQLSEANEAIVEVIRELSKKPINIKILNTRVDTARDLALKVYLTANRNLEDAKTCENLIVYANKYRSEHQKLDEVLNEAERNFFKGEYSRCLEVSLSALELVENDIREIYNEVK